MIAFLERLQENMIRFPDKPALGFSLDDRDISYRELDEISGKVHRWLAERGIGREDNVLIKLPRGPMIIAMIIGPRGSLINTLSSFPIPCTVSQRCTFPLISSSSR